MRRWAASSMVVLIAAFVLMLPFFSAWPRVGENAAGEVQQLIDRLKAISNFKSEFRQINYISAIREETEYKGTLIFRKPCDILLKVSFPKKQLIIATPERTVFYDPSKKQMIISGPVDDKLAKFFSSLLGGSSKIGEAFKVIRLAEPLSYKFLPKERSTVDHIAVLLDKKSLFPRRITIFQRTGDYSSIFLRDIVYNFKDVNKEFDFSPPAGTEIIDNFMKTQLK